MIFCNFFNAFLFVWIVFLSDTSKILYQHIFDILMRGLELPIIIQYRRDSIMCSIGHGGSMKKSGITLSFFEPLNSGLLCPKYFLLFT